MAAAVLGHAARRLGGGALRQTQEAAVSRLTSAVEQQQQRLMPRRFAHTEVVHPCDCRKFEKVADLKRLQKQKEELFEAATEVHRKYGMGEDSACRTNRALLRQLSDHVCRRSTGDRTWEWVRKSQARHDVLKAAGFVTLVNVGVNRCFSAIALALRD